MTETTSEDRITEGVIVGLILLMVERIAAMW